MRLIPMQDRKGKPGDRADPYASEAAERRRAAKVIHDDRGNATVEWVDAPANHERPLLSLDETDPVKKRREGYNPYETIANKPRDPLHGGGDPYGRPQKRDLRKLSEWIKQMRELEERKKRGDEE